MMNRNNNNIEVDQIRTQHVQDKLDALERVQENLLDAIQEILTLNRELRQMRADRSYDHCLGEEIQHYLQLSSDLRSAVCEWGFVLNFMQECVHLRCNSDKVTDVYVHVRQPAPLDYGHLIGNCLRQNMRVSNIRISLETLIGPDKDKVDGNIHALCDFIQRSPGLRNVSLYRDTTCAADATLATKFLESIGHNQRIEEVHCSLVHPPTALHTLLSTSLSILVLGIECHGWTTYSLPGRDLLPLAIASSRSVASLKLSQEGHDCIMMNSIIENIAKRYTPVEKLTIMASKNPEPLPALVSFLPHTTTLQHVEFLFYNLDTDNIECILEGLRLHYNGSRSNTITKLSFLNCEFTDPASVKFFRLMQSPTNRSVGLQELEMKLLQTTFAGVPVGTSMATLLIKVPVPDSRSHCQMTNNCNRAPTIGSQLQMLSLCPFFKMEGFLTAMQSQSHEVVDLPKLCLSDLGDNECAQLNKCLPYLPSLRELHLDFRYKKVAPETVLTIYRQCGSLHGASVLHGEDNQPLLTGRQGHMLDAYCKRNQVLWKMLSLKTLWSWSDNVQYRTQGHAKKKKQRCHNT